MKRLYDNIGVYIPEIMLPAKGTDLNKWAVVACDQHTSQPDYWEEVEKLAGDSPSTLYLTFPEIFLKDDDKDTRIKKINSQMEKYIKERILESQKPGFILVERSTPHASSRKGLIMAVDLEKYDYNRGSQTLIRTTEGTVLDRIPPRVKIRENARIELPHVMILIDDPDKTVIESLFDRLDLHEKLYDFDLMQNGGHIKGWKVEDDSSISGITGALERLADPAYFSNKYNTEPEKGVLLFAVGDGNHSLASAKSHWENVKASSRLDGNAYHPARFALVEVVNVHDSGIVFEPIHRVLFGIDPKTILEKMVQFYSGRAQAEYRLFETKAALEDALTDLKISENTHNIPFILEGAYGLITVKNPSSNLAVGTLQAFLDQLVKDEDVEADYIHGGGIVTELGSKTGNMGFYMPAMDKHDLFKTVILDGALPRKTFSMGEAEEKRYYLECRCIR